MNKQNELEYLKLSGGRRFFVKLAGLFSGIPAHLPEFFRKAGNRLRGLGKKIRDEARDIINTFARGSWKTRISYLFMGFGNLARGQIVRGLLFLAFEVVFILYMILAGAHWLGKMATLGDTPPGEIYDEVLDTYVRVDGDDSFKILLYGLLTIFFLIAAVVTWRINVRQNRVNDEIEAEGKRVRHARDDLAALLDKQFHKTLLALPMAGILLFTVLPVIFMILVAFTNYDGAHDGYSNLFTWVGGTNFNELLNLGGADSRLSFTFGEILSWTLIWAFFATFTNYFLGMLVAMMINKKGIRLKKLWRGILVMTIAIPQFVSLLYVSRMFNTNGIINGVLLNLGLITEPLKFWNGSALGARTLLILINIWIGVPYLMLITSGILMNIPKDLYESARIDGASPWQQYVKITLPYMLFVTGPYLLTSFISNINNFNVIYLLANGRPVNPEFSPIGGGARDTDLLITWLFNITTGAESNYRIAAVISIMIFIVVAVISLIVYNVIPSTKNEGDFS